MVVGDAVNEGIRPARPEAAFVGARPDIGAQETAAFDPRQDDGLRSIGTLDTAFAVAALQLRDENIAEEGAIVRQSGECNTPLGE